MRHAGPAAMTPPSLPGSAGERPVRAPGPRAGRPAGPGVPLSVWPGLPAPARAPPGQPCRRPGPPGDLAGHVVAAARAAGLAYAQHIVLVHAAIDGDRLDPAGPAPGTASPPGGTRVHSDLLVFTKPGLPVSSAELKDSQPEHAV